MYTEVKNKIKSTLVDRPAGTEVQVEKHQDYALSLLEYVRSLEIVAQSSLVGVATPQTEPVQPPTGRVSYIAGVDANSAVEFPNFLDVNGNPIIVTTGVDTAGFVLLVWNTKYWTAELFDISFIPYSARTLTTEQELDEALLPYSHPIDFEIEYDQLGISKGNVVVGKSNDTGGVVQVITYFRDRNYTAVRFRSDAGVWGNWDVFKPNSVLQADVSTAAQIAAYKQTFIPHILQSTTAISVYRDNEFVGTIASGSILETFSNGNLNVIKSSEITIESGNVPGFSCFGTVSTNSTPDPLDPAYSDIRVDIVSLLSWDDPSAMMYKSGLNSRIQELTFVGVTDAGQEILLKANYNPSEGTFDFQLPNGVTGQMFKELFVRGKCVGNVRTNWPIQFIGSQGGHILVKEYTPAEVDILPRSFLGISTHSQSNGGFVYITWFGNVNDVDTSGWYAQDSTKQVLYLNTNGVGWNGMSVYPQHAPHAKIIVGAIERYSTGGAANGRIFVRPTFGVKLGELQDVETVGSAAGQPLVKNADGTWKPANLLTINEITPSGGIFTLNGTSNFTGPITTPTLNATTKVVTPLLQAEEITSSGSHSVGGHVSSTLGFKKPGYTDSELLTANGGTIAITELKRGVYRLFKPDGSASILEINNAGQVLIYGDIIQNGQAYKIDAEEVTTKEQIITLRSDATTGMPLEALAGFIIKLYDGVNDGMIVIDRDGVLRIGDVGDLQPVMTREETPVDNSPLHFNSTAKRAETIPVDSRKTIIDSNDDFFLNDSEDGNKPKRISGQVLKDDIKDYVGTDLMFYLDESDTGVTLGLGDEVYVTEDTGIYPSITLNVITD